SCAGYGGSSPSRKGASFPPEAPTRVREIFARVVKERWEGGPSRLMKQKIDCHKLAILLRIVYLNGMGQIPRRVSLWLALRRGREEESDGGPGLPRSTNLFFFNSL